MVGVANGGALFAEGRSATARSRTGTCPSRACRTSSRSRSATTPRPGHRPARLPISVWTPSDRPGWSRACGTPPRRSPTSSPRSGATPSQPSASCTASRQQRMETQSIVTLGMRPLQPLARRAGPRARAPVVRRRGHPRRLERPLDERGHGDLPRRGELDRDHGPGARTSILRGWSSSRRDLRERYGHRRLRAGFVRRGQRLLLPCGPDVGHDPAAPRRQTFWRARGPRGREPSADQPGPRHPRRLVEQAVGSAAWRR